MILILSNPNYAPWIGLFLRLALAWALPLFLDDGRLLPGVSYTDIDYLVFTDAAQYLQSGQSPYDRHTYRYTPFLAALLAKLPSKEGGRYIFCLADALCGWIILVLRRSQRRQQQISSDGLWVQLADSLWWLYNPLAINICTRGSSESLMVLLPVLLTYWIATNHERQTRYTSPTDGDRRDTPATILQAFWAGICHGLAIHSKLYPVIYTLSYMAYFATPPRVVANVPAPRSAKIHSSFPWTNPRKLLRLAKLWFHRLFLAAPFLPIIFLVTATLTFASLTWLAVDKYGEAALQEGLLYHFSRVDHRHNYSMYWYWIYLARARASDAAAAMPLLSPSDDAAIVGTVPTSSLATMGRLLLLPQAFLLACSSLGLAPNPNQLGLALFVQTYIFVTHNKVITAQ
jgi:phosphatidylinositol glycan class M